MEFSRLLAADVVDWPGLSPERLCKVIASLDSELGRPAPGNALECEGLFNLAGHVGFVAQHLSLVDGRYDGCALAAARLEEAVRRAALGGSILRADLKRPQHTAAAARFCMLCLEHSDSAERAALADVKDTERLSAVRVEFSEQLRCDTEVSELIWPCNSAQEAAKALGELGKALFSARDRGVKLTFSPGHRERVARCCTDQGLLRAYREGVEALGARNAPLVEEILALKTRIARAEGFDSVAQKSLRGKAIGSEERLQAFLATIKPAFFAKFEADKTTAQKLYPAQLEPWNLENAFHTGRVKLSGITDS